MLIFIFIVKCSAMGYALRIFFFKSETSLRLLCPDYLQYVVSFILENNVINCFNMNMFIIVIFIFKIEFINLKYLVTSEMTLK